MRDLNALTRSLRRARRWVGRSNAGSARAGRRFGRAALSRLLAEGRSEAGVTLIEVIASTLIVGLIVVGTLTGFGSAGRAIADERQRGQATLLAAQDEERLRGMNVTELGRFGVKTSEVSEGGTKFTIESKAQFVSASKETFACETSEAAASYIQTSSTVTWPQLTNSKGKREGVSQSSIVPVPTSDSVLVKVHNQANEAVEGATVKITGKESGAVSEQVTPVSGCVIFGALSDAEVTIAATKAGWINEKLETEPSPQEAKLSKTAIVSKTFVMAAPGLINAQFVSGASGAGAQGDTFHVGHTGAPEKVVGTAGSGYASTLLSSSVFPYQTPGSPPTASKYLVYAGECEKSQPSLVNSTELTNPEVQVEPGAQASVKVEVPLLNLLVDEGAVADSKAEAKVTDACGSVRTMKTTSGGTLEHPYLPYGKTKLCVSQTIGTTRYSHTTEFTISAKAGYPSNGTPLVINLTATENKNGPAC